MKKTIAACLIVIGISLPTWAALSWDAPASNLFNAPFEMLEGWTAYIYHDVDGNMAALNVKAEIGWMNFLSGQISNGATVYGNPILDFTASLLNSKGNLTFGESFADGWETSHGGKNVYTVVFDNANYTLANNFFVFSLNDFGTSIKTLSNTPNDTYGVVNGGYWAIPEPATALLFILGSMGAWLARRNNKMKADAEADA